MMVWKVMIMILAVIGGERLPVKDYDTHTTTNTEEECRLILPRVAHDTINSEIMMDPALDFLETQSLRLYLDCKEVLQNDEEDDEKR